MYLIAIAWMYVVLMMALAEALSSQGTVLGALFTLLLYGLLPLSILLYILGTPLRRRRRLRLEAAGTAGTAEAADAADAAASTEASARTANAGGHPPRDAIAPERKEG